MGAIKVSDSLRSLLEATPDAGQRKVGWRVAKAIAERARMAGFAGVVIMGLRFETAVGEGYEAWHDDTLLPLERDETERATA